LYGIAHQLIDSDFGLHGPIGIPELFTLDLENQTQFGFGFSVCKVTLWSLGGLV
jgi:hypothetical protein